MSAFYVVKEGIAGFKRARFAAFSSITAIALSLLLLAVLARVSFNAYELADSIRADVQVEIYLQDIDENRKNSIRQSLLEYSIVQEVEFVSREQAMEIFRADFGVESELLGNVNFLPASFKVITTPEARASEIQELVSEVRSYRGVEEVTFNQRGLELLEERLRVLIIVGILLGAFIGLIAMILVYNTIRLTIYSKKDLIKAMKLVGATNSFIKRPFMFEGVLQGLIASGVAILGMWALFQYVIPRYLPQAGVISWPFGEWYFLTGALIVLGLIMGYFSSRLAAKKFIRETGIS